jgi:hypothetical protein
MTLENAMKNFAGAAGTAVEAKVEAVAPKAKATTEAKPKAKTQIKVAAAKKSKITEAKPKATTRRTPYGDDAVIELAKTFDASAYSGSRGVRAALLKDGMSVGDWNAACLKKASKPGKGWLHALAEAGVVTVK